MKVVVFWATMFLLAYFYNGWKIANKQMNSEFFDRPLFMMNRNPRALILGACIWPVTLSTQYGLGRRMVFGIAEVISRLVISTMLLALVAAVGLVLQASSWGVAGFLVALAVDWLIADPLVNWFVQLVLFFVLSAIINKAPGKQ